MGHIRIKHPSDFVCQLCGYSFVSEKGIALHKKLKHRQEDAPIPENGPQCEPCGIRFVDSDAIRRHLAVSARHNSVDKVSRKRKKLPNGRKTRESRRAKDRREKEDKLFPSQLIKAEGPIPCEQIPGDHVSEPLKPLYLKTYTRVRVINENTPTPISIAAKEEIMVKTEVLDNELNEGFSQEIMAVKTEETSESIETQTYIKQETEKQTQNGSQNLLPDIKMSYEVPVVKIKTEYKSEDEIDTCEDSEDNSLLVPIGEVVTTTSALFDEPFVKDEHFKVKEEIYLEEASVSGMEAPQSHDHGRDIGDIQSRLGQEIPGAPGRPIQRNGNSPRSLKVYAVKKKHLTKTLNDPESDDKEKFNDKCNMDSANESIDAPINDANETKHTLTFEDIFILQKQDLSVDNKTSIKRVQKCTQYFDLLQHSRTLIRRDAFKCQKCGENFTVKSDLNKHLCTQTHFKCDECGKIITKKRYYSHLWLHFRLKPFECNECGKKFRHKSDLREHLQIHFDIKTYTCSVCDKKFRMKCNLRSHMQIHSVDRRFTCDHCGSSFKLKSGLKVHLTIHSDRKPISCHLCENNYINRKGLRKHMRTKHREFLNLAKVQQ